MLGFFAAEGKCLFADLGGALEEIEAAVVLGEAFARNWHAFDFEFESFVAVNEAGEECEVRSGGVGSGGALEEMALEGGRNGGIEGGIVGAGGVGDFCGFDLVGG